MMSPYQFFLKGGAFFTFSHSFLSLKPCKGCMSVNMSDGQFQKKIHNFQNNLSNRYLAELEKENISLKVLLYERPCCYGPW